jgi:hypothetical protein
MMHKGDNIRVKGIVIAIASILILSTAVMGVSADTASIWTDKEDYSPGETVTIYGSGFNPNAEIRITIVQPNGTEVIITANSDDNGSFENNDYVIDNDDPVGTYTVTATDGTNTARTTFTDAPKVGSVSVSPTSVTVTAGGTATYTVIVNRGSEPESSGTFRANLSIVGSLPSGTTATFDPNPVSFTPTDNSKTSTLTIQTSTTTSSGTYTFKVKAATSDRDFAESGDVTLTVNAPPPPADTTLPVITPNISGTLGNNGWYTSDVIVSWNVSDPESGIASSSGCGTVTINYDTTGETLTCSATNGAGLSDYVSVTIKRDATPPTVYATPDRPADNNGWYNHPLTITFTGDDDTSGIASCDDPVTYNGPDGTGITVDGTCTDNAGNSATGSFTFDYDATPPTVNISDISNGQQFDFGDPLPSVTCSAEDDLSGIESASCTIDGSLACTPSDGSCTIDPETLPTSVGEHTITVTAKDKAGNEATASIQYTIVAWTIKGFYQPVDMNGVVNVAKAGSTIPLKFEVFKTISEEEITDTSIIVQPLKAQKISCNNINGLPTDEIELTATGGTSLRYDPIEEQFIYNWKTPTQKDTCWKVTVSTIDGSSIYAYFRLK